VLIRQGVVLRIGVWLLLVGVEVLSHVETSLLVDLAWRGEGFCEDVRVEYDTNDTKKECM
jgi:hypothetical protein